MGRTLPIASINRTPVVPDRVAWLREEMLKTRVAYGYCALPAEVGACPYANICEQCDNFMPAPDFAPVLQAQLADVHTLREDARSPAGPKKPPATTASSPPSRSTSTASTPPAEDRPHASMSPRAGQ